MTPTLLGRWQTRLILFGTVGLAVTAVFATWFQNSTPYLLLGLVFVLGCGWDVLYQQMQRRRWDRDWPPNLQLAAGIWEAIVVAGLLYGVGILRQPPTVGQFVGHYTAVWLTTFLASQSVLRLIFPAGATTAANGFNFSGWWLVVGIHNKPLATNHYQLATISSGETS